MHRSAGRAYPRCIFDVPYGLACAAALVAGLAQRTANPCTLLERPPRCIFDAPYGPVGSSLIIASQRRHVEYGHSSTRAQCPCFTGLL